MVDSMQSVQHQMMGYDRAITMFSPDGRLLQVEYARKTVKLGNTAMGIVCQDGIILVTDKRIVDKLVVPEAVEKIFKVDEHIMATAAGILADARVLVERSQVKAQQHQVTYDSPIDILTIVKDICDLKQLTTQSGGLRPFGVSLLLAGKDEKGLRLFETDPTGSYYEYKASVIGEYETEIETMLHKEYKESWSVDDGLKFAIKGIKKVLDKNFDEARIDAAIIKKDNPKMIRLDKAQIKKYLK